MTTAVPLPPSSSPRLPSPPPIAEDQIGPTSPGISLYEDQSKLLSPASDHGAQRRIRPGTKADDMAEGPPLIQLHDIESAFQLTEHLQSLYYHHTHPEGSNTVIPVTADLARELCKPPANTAKEIWLYELCRLLINKTNAIIVHLFADSPPCSPQTCPEMRASEWQYLCAVHDPPKSCAAIDYCCHTLDGAATALTSTKMFPSRLGLGSGGAGGGQDKFLTAQIKEITNIFRRVYRIYAHAWFQHRDMFWRVEGKTGLYIFFKTVCDVYNLIQPENYTIPPEAEGHDAEDYAQEEQKDRPQAPSILQRGSESEGSGQAEPGGDAILSAANTAKKHSNHIRGISQSMPTTVIQEEAEEEEEEESQSQPRLDRTSTIFHAPAIPVESTEDPLAAADHDDDEPLAGISRSDTLKPESPNTSSAPVADEVIEPGDETTILAEPEPEPETKAEEPGVEVRIQAVEALKLTEPESGATEVKGTETSVTD